MTPPDKNFQELMALARGFQSAKLFMVAVDLGVFDFLDEPRSAVETAAYIKADERATGIFLNALAAMGLLVKGVDYFRNGDLVSEFLVRGKDNYRGAIIRHMHHTLRGWEDLAHTVLAGHPRDLDPEKWVETTKQRDEDEMRDFIWGMHALARDLAPQVAAQLDLKGVKHLLDLGGGPGTYAIFFAKTNPELKATVFDLPGPSEIARENIARYGLSHRISTLSGNFLKVDIGSGYDFIWVSHILHSHDEEQSRYILKKAIDALTPGGRLAVQDFYLNDDGYSPPGAAMFSAHMLAVTPRGRSYTHSEVAEWMEELGTTRPYHQATSPEASILVGTKR